MLAAAEWGFTPVCINTRAENFSIFGKLGFETHEQDIYSLQQPERFRVISLTNFGRLHSPPLRYSLHGNFLYHKAFCSFPPPTKGRRCGALSELSTSH